MKCDPQQTSLRSKVHAQIEHGALNSAIHNALYFPGVFLQQEKIVWSDKRHRDRRDEIAYNLSDGKVWNEHRWTTCLRSSNFIGARIEPDSQLPRGEHKKSTPTFVSFLTPCFVGGTFGGGFAANQGRKTITSCCCNCLLLVSSFLIDYVDRVVPM